MTDHRRTRPTRESQSRFSPARPRQIDYTHKHKLKPLTSKRTKERKSETTNHHFTQTPPAAYAAAGAGEAAVAAAAAAAVTMRGTVRVAMQINKRSPSLARLLAICLLLERTSHACVGNFLQLNKCLIAARMAHSLCVATAAAVAVVHVKDSVFYLSHSRHLAALLLTKPNAIDPYFVGHRAGEPQLRF